MKDIPISDRLKTLAQFIPKEASLADIGSDHAYLPCYAYVNGMIMTAIAGEVNAGPFHSAQETIEKYGLKKYITARLGNGLSVIERGEVNTVTIAGMGGELIRQILDEGKDRLTDEMTLILQPNVAEDRVRLWLVNEGWTICDEEILEEDGHIYEIIVAKRGLSKTPLLEDEIMFGPKLIQQKNESFIKKWKWELQKRERILQSLQKATQDEGIEARVNDVASELKRIKEVLK